MRTAHNGLHCLNKLYRNLVRKQKVCSTLSFRFYWKQVFYTHLDIFLCIFYHNYLPHVEIRVCCAASNCENLCSVDFKQQEMCYQVVSKQLNAFKVAQSRARCKIFLQEALEPWKKKWVRDEYPVYLIYSTKTRGEYKKQPRN